MGIPTRPRTSRRHATCNRRLASNRSRGPAPCKLRQHIRFRRRTRCRLDSSQTSQARRLLTNRGRRKRARIRRRSRRSTSRRPDSARLPSSDQQCAAGTFRRRKSMPTRNPRRSHSTRAADPRCRRSLKRLCHPCHRRRPRRRSRTCLPYRRRPAPAPRWCPRKRWLTSSTLKTQRAQRDSDQPCALLQQWACRPARRRHSRFFGQSFARSRLHPIAAPSSNANATTPTKITSTTPLYPGSSPHTHEPMEGRAARASPARWRSPNAALRAPTSVLRAHP